MEKLTIIASRKNKPGGGRKTGTGKFLEPTTALRVPASQEPIIKDFLAAYQRRKLANSLDVVSDFEWPKLLSQPVLLPLYSCLLYTSRCV